MRHREVERTSPWLAYEQVEVLRVGDNLVAGPSLVPIEKLYQYGLITAHKRTSAQRAIFGFRLPFLPILVESDNLVGQNTRERVAEVLDDQFRLVLSLSKWHSAAFSLRYIHDPTERRIGVVLLGRLLAEQGRAAQLASRVSSDIVHQLYGLHFEPVPISSDLELNDVLSLSHLHSIVEIWQAERLVVLTVERNHGLEEIPAVVICPFRRPQSATWLSTFRAITESTFPLAVNIHIEPTDLLWFEEARLETNAEQAGSLRKYTIRRNTGDREVASPVAEMVAQMYGDAWQRLTRARPLLMTIQVASSDATTVMSIAQQLASELTEQRPFDPAGHELNSPLPSGYEIVAPANQSDARAVRQTLVNMDLHPLESSGVNERGRLRYLVDQHTASAAFRFPVPLRAGIPGIACHRVAPQNYRVHVDRVSEGQDKQTVYIGTLGSDRVSFPISELSRHMLVAGTNGSGKTTSVMHLLAQLWQLGRPFLVIEPAKREYRTLLRGPFGKDLRIFTLGDEQTAPFRLNPLEILPGVLVETHIGTVRACLESVMPQFGILPSLIEQSLRRAYYAKGWSLSDRGQETEARLMPTLGEFYFELIRTLQERKYSGATHQDLRGAATGRIAPLLWGSKGRMLNTMWSYRFEDLMSKPTVLELEAINDEEKALVIMFLLNMIREYCSTIWGDGKLHHVLVIEEAHRVMAKIPHAFDRDVSSDTRAQAVSLVTSALSEVRALGQGIVVAEQIPSRLAEDAMKNTNIKIVHQLPGEDDRDAIGGTIGAGFEQKNYIGELTPGEAAVFLPGYSQPAFLRVPDFRGEHALPSRIADRDVKNHMDSLIQSRSFYPFSACEYCRAPCKHRDRVAEYAYTIASAERFTQACADWLRECRKGNHDEAWRSIASACIDGIGDPMYLDDDCAYCYFAHMWNGEVTEDMVSKLRDAFVL